MVSSRKTWAVLAALPFLLASAGCSVGAAGIVASAGPGSSADAGAQGDGADGGATRPAWQTRAPSEKVASETAKPSAPVAAAPAADPCSAAEIYAGGPQYPGGGVEVEECDGEWAYVSSTSNGETLPGDGQSLYRKVGGSWTRYSGFPTTIDQCQARQDGVPQKHLSSFKECSGGSSSGGGSSSDGSSADLGLSIPMSRPACDGRGIVVLYSAVVPGQYKSEISSALAMYPGAQYLRTDHACPSLRQRDDAGNLIYAVYRPSGYSQSEVCADVRAAGGSAYGRWLSNSIPSTHRITC